GGVLREEQDPALEPHLVRESLDATRFERSEHAGKITFSLGPEQADVQSDALESTAQARGRVRGDGARVESQPPKCGRPVECNSLRRWQYAAAKRVSREGPGVAGCLWPGSRYPHKFAPVF